MDKKYRSEDKKVVFITNCIPSIPETPQNQCHVKNIRHANHQYTSQLIASPPILKAYNHRMGGVDKHDRLVGQHAIPLISKRGYLRIFFHLLDTALVNVGSSSGQPSKRGVSGTRQPNDATHWLGSKNQSYYHSVAIMSRKYQASHTGIHPTLPIQSLELITQHQVQPISPLVLYLQKGYTLNTIVWLLKTFTTERKYNGTFRRQIKDERQSRLSVAGEESVFLSVVEQYHTWSDDLLVDRTLYPIQDGGVDFVLLLLETYLL